MVLRNKLKKTGRTVFRVNECFLKRKGASQVNLKKLKPEEKVNLSINMTDVCVQICADGIRDQNRNITEAQLREEVRRRIMYQKRRHYEV